MSFCGIWGQVNLPGFRQVLNESPLSKCDFESSMDHRRNFNANSFLPSRSMTGISEREEERLS